MPECHEDPGQAHCDQVYPVEPLAPRGHPVSHEWCDEPYREQQWVDENWIIDVPSVHTFILPEKR